MMKKQKAARQKLDLALFSNLKRDATAVCSSREILQSSTDYPQADLTSDIRQDRVKCGCSGRGMSGQYCGRTGVSRT